MITKTPAEITPTVTIPQQRKGDPPSAPPAPDTRVFSPPRLRAYRHRRGLAVHQLAAQAGLGPEVVEAVENAAHRPSQGAHAALAQALECTPADLCAPEAEANDNRQYWAAVAATAPPMSTRDIDSVGAILRRIDRRDGPT